MEQDYRDRHPVVNITMAVLGFLDLDSKEKALMALIEIVPTVGLWYAVLGHRIRIHTDHTLSLQKISLLDRGYYLVGEFLVSGHILAGIHHSIRREGGKRVRRQLIQAFTTRTKELLARRALEGAGRVAAFVKRSL